MPKLKEVLPPPLPKEKQPKKESKPKHKVVSVGDVLAYMENGKYICYGDNVKPSKTVLLKRVRQWEASPTTMKKKKTCFKVNKTAYELVYDPKSRKLTQRNIASTYTRTVKVLSDIRVTPPLPFYSQTSFPKIPLPDLHKILTEATVGARLPDLLAACFTSLSRQLALKIKDVVEVSELDRLKKDYAIGLHGTSDHAAQRIIQNGFDMSRFGQRAAYHGHGVYITACLPTAQSYGQHLLLVAFHTNPKPHLLCHGSSSKGLNTAVVKHAKNVLPLMWLTQ